MERGRFFEPRALGGLADADLAAYCQHCEASLRLIEQDFAYLDGQRSALSAGFRVDGALTIAGLLTSAASLAGIAVFTFMGFLTLAGGALSLIGAHRYGERYIERSLLIDQVRSRRASIGFLHSELKRIWDEANRRGVR